MDIDQIKKFAQFSENLAQKPVAVAENTDPVKAMMLPGVSAHNPPGALADFCEIIGNHFERRYGCEMYRIIGALSVAQVIAGRNVVTPTKSKAMFQMMLVAPSGSGKTACMDFVASAAYHLGASKHFLGSTVTSLKQLQMSMIEAGGSLLYLVDDNEGHVLNWDNERSPLDGVSSFIRAQSSTQQSWSATSTIRAAFDEVLTSASSMKVIEAKARVEGWHVPRVGDSKDIDFNAFEKMNQPIAKRFAEAKRNADLANSDIERFKLVPVISLTPDKGQRIINNWRENGSMGRTLFVYRDGEIAEKKDIPEEWKYAPFVNMWKPRMPNKLMTGEWGEGCEELFKELDRKLDSLRNSGGIVGVVSARYGQMMLDIATLCAFVDPEARSQNSFVIGEVHLKWAFQTCLESLVAMRDYHEGEPDDTGLEYDEWLYLVSQVKQCVEGVKFQETPTIAVISDRVCRNKRVELLISAAISARIEMTKKKLILNIIECMSQWRHAPIELDPNASNRVRLVEGGSWEDIPMDNTIRDLLTKALGKKKFIKTKK